VSFSLALLSNDAYDVVTTVRIHTDSLLTHSSYRCVSIIMHTDCARIYKNEYEGVQHAHSKLDFQMSLKNCSKTMNSAYKSNRSLSIIVWNI